MKKSLILCICFITILSMCSCTSSDNKKNSETKAQFVNEKYANVKFKLEGSWKTRYESDFENIYTYKDYMIAMGMRDFSNEHSSEKLEDILQGLLNSDFPEDKRTSPTKQENIEIDGEKAVLTTFNAPASLYDGKPGEKQVSVKRAYTIIDETLYFFDFINNDSTNHRNESVYQEYFKSIQIDKGAEIDWFAAETLKQERFRDLEFMVKWKHKTNESNKVMYSDGFTIGIMVEDNSSDQKNASFEKIIEEHFYSNKIDHLTLLEEVNGGTKIDHVAGSESLYKGKLQVFEDAEFMIDIVMFEHDDKRYFLILSGVDENIEATFQEDRGEFHKFIKSIKIVS